MIKNPSVSFIMLSWNRREFVKKLFESFYSKKSDNIDYEFWIVDNGSKDGTVELLKDLEQKDANLKIKYNKKNNGLKSYKKLFYKCTGDYIITIDDDILDFPENFPLNLVHAIDTAVDFGYIALDVFQDEYTNGAKPEATKYIDMDYDGFTLQKGPVGGWCSILRKSDFNKFKIKFFFERMTMKNGDDKILNSLVSYLGLKRGILKDVKCLHACGPYYSKKYGYLERDIEKYKKVGLDSFVEAYQKYLD